jgi:hypothetical protein
MYFSFQIPHQGISFDIAGMDDGNVHLPCVCVVESNSGSLEGRVVPFDRNFANVWNVFLLIMILSYFEGAFESMGYLILTGGYLSTHCFLSFFVFLYVSCSLACFCFTMHFWHVFLFCHSPYSLAHEYFFGERIIIFWSIFSEMRKCVTL